MIRVILLSLLAALLVAAGLPYLIATPQFDGRIPDQPFADSRFAEVLGTRLHWRERGPEASPALIVLLHGFGGSGFSWRHSLDALEARGYLAIAPDLPPFGYSERRGDGPDWPALVIDLAEQRGGDRPWVLVGHSMGVGVAAEVVNRRPDRAAGLIMVSGTPRLGDDHRGLSWLFALPPVGRWAEVWASRHLVEPDAIKRMLDSALGRPPTEQEFAGYYRPLLIPDSYPALLRRMAARATVGDAWMDSPHAIIWGAGDSWVPLERARALVDRLPEPIELQVLAEAAHNPMDTHPAEFNRRLLTQIDTFLN
jgi:pimeloyl-ACP methyl ester carboxylesterase